MGSVGPFGSGHQVATLLITTTALAFPVFSQHMMTLGRSVSPRVAVFAPGRTGGRGRSTLSPCVYVSRLLSVVDGLSSELAQTNRAWLANYSAARRDAVSHF